MCQGLIFNNVADWTLNINIKLLIQIHFLLCRFQQTQAFAPFMQCALTPNRNVQQLFAPCQYHI